MKTNHLVLMLGVMSLVTSVFCVRLAYTDRVIATEAKASMESFRAHYEAYKRTEGKSVDNAYSCKRL